MISKHHVPFIDEEEKKSMMTGFKALFTKSDKTAWMSYHWVLVNEQIGMNVT